MNSRTIAAGYNGPVKIELLKGAGLLSIQRRADFLIPILTQK